jgi:multiple sugar transport system substrate-binding protein
MAGMLAIATSQERKGRFELDNSAKDSAKVIADRIVNRGISRRGLVKGAAVAGAVAAIGVPSATFFAPTVLGQSKAKVTFWTTHSDIGLTALKQIGTDFNAQSKTSEVEVVQRPPADVTDSSSLITAVRGGQGPDVYLLDRFIVAERAAQGLLQDLTQLMTDDGQNPDLTEKWVPFSAAEATYDSKPYALPFDTDVRALFYNKKMFTDAGVDLAPFDNTKGPMTFDAFAELAAKLDVDGGDNYSSLGFVPYFSQGMHYTWGFAFGGSFFDYEKCEVTPDNEGVIAGGQWVYDYSKKYNADKLYAFIQNAMRTGAAPTDSPFIQKRLGAYISGNWEFQNFKKYIPDVDVGYTYIPVPKEGDTSATWAGGWSGVIPQGAKNVAGGYEFLKYLAGPDGSKTYVKLNNNLPVLKELLADASLFDENLKWFVDNLFPTTHNRPPLPVGAKYWDELTTAWEAIYLNQSTPQDALGQTKQNVQADLDAGGFCPIAAPATGDATPKA